MAIERTRRATLSKSEQMSRVRSNDTRPEKLVRTLLSGLGVRYRLHRNDLPGRPDLYIGRLRLAIFVNGCFWHGHNCARAGHVKTNTDFWHQKIAKNVRRDAHAIERLDEMGIDSLTFWTCQESQFPLTCGRLARLYKKAAP